MYTAAWTAALIAARKSHPALQGAALQDLFTDETAFVFVRTANLGRCTADHAHEAVLVILNTKPVPRSLTIPAGDTAPEGCRHLQLLAPVDNGSTFVLNGAVQVELPADSFSLFLVR